MGLALLVGLAASAGALARYLVDQSVTHKLQSALPWGTFVINISGSFILGLLTGLSAHAGLPAHVLTVLGTGICGGYTTFSTFSYESVRLGEDGSIIAGFGNVFGSVIAGLLAAAAGLGLALAF